MDKTQDLINRKLNMTGHLQQIKTIILEVGKKDNIL